MAKKKDDFVEETGEKTAEQVIRNIRRAFNKEDEDRACWDLSAEESPTDVKDFISTGSTLLDYVISNRRNGGVPTGKLTEIQGEESSGKSLLCSHIIANTQKKGGIAVYIDTENAANPAFMKQLGVDLSALVYMQTGTMEKTFEAIEKIILTTRAKNSSCPITIVWDSIAATPPQSEIEGDYDPNSRIGVMAKTLAKGLRKITDLIGKERITLVFTNQLKQRPGVMYGDPFITPGGKAIAYHSSVRIRLTSSTKLKDAAGDIFAINTKAKTIKTRLGPPHRKCEFEIHFDHGVDDAGSWFGVLHGAGLIEKRAGYCYITHESLVSSELKFREKEWRSMVVDGAPLRNKVLDVLEKLLVKSYSDPQEREGTIVDAEGEEIEEL